MHRPICADVDGSRSPLLRSIGFAILAALALPAVAQATEFCNPKRTRDGFVALRAGPSRHGL